MYKPKTNVNLFCDNTDGYIARFELPELKNLSLGQKD